MDLYESTNPVALDSEDDDSEDDSDGEEEEEGLDGSRISSVGKASSAVHATRQTPELEVDDEEETPALVPAAPPIRRFPDELQNHVLERALQLIRLALQRALALNSPNEQPASPFQAVATVLKANYSSVARTLMQFFEHD